MKTDSLYICADDFGLHPAINRGIVELLLARKINAVSCMSNQPYFSEGANALKTIENIKIGLHFNLPYRSLSRFILGAYTCTISSKKIMTALETQYHLFLKQMGRAPDFIDGHQHIHQLPGVRQIILHFYKIHFSNTNTFIRNTNNQQKNIKGFLLRHLGARTLEKQLIAANIPHNQNFSGIYTFSQSATYATYFKEFLKEIQGNGLIMCHPSQSASDIEPFRVNEYQTLMHSDFIC